MRIFVCSGLLLGALGACSTTVTTEVCGNGVLEGSEQCDDGAGNGVDGVCSSACTLVSTPTGHITASWTLKNIATNTNTACPTGFDTGALYVQAADNNGNPIGTCTTVSNTCFIDLFNCSAMAGTSDPLPASPYIAWIQIENHDGSQVYAKSTEAFVDITNVDKSMHADILNDGGYFYLTWSLYGANSNATLTCAQAGVTGGVETIATLNGTSTAYNDQFNCTDHFDYTAGVPAGTYTVSVDAFNSANQALGSPVNLTNKSVATQNQITDLGHIMLPIDGL